MPVTVTGPDLQNRMAMQSNCNCINQFIYFIAAVLWQLLYSIMERYMKNVSEKSTPQDWRRWAYEIFSVFLMERSVLQSHASTFSTVK